MQLNFLPIATRIQRLVINETERRGCSTSPIPPSGSRIALPQDKQLDSPRRDILTVPIRHEQGTIHPKWTFLLRIF